jgi:hypothetical protein
MNQNPVKTGRDESELTKENTAFNSNAGSKDS